VASVHLGVVELHRDGERYLEPTLAIAAPGKEGIIIDTTVLIYDAVKLCTCNGRCAKYHRLLVSYLLAVGATLEGDGIVVATKLLEIIVIRYVASADAAFGIVYYHVDGQTVELVQFAILWQQVELVYISSRPPQAPAQQLIELQAIALAHLAQLGNIKRLDECDHRHRRLHPHLERPSTAGFIRVYFLFHRFYLYFLRCKDSEC